MNYETKRASTGLSVKAEGEGLVTVEFARPDGQTIDHDGDVTMPGAFGQQDVRIQSHGHDTARWTIGKGQISERDGKAILEGQLNLKMQEGREAFESLRFDLEHDPPLQEWSYTFAIEDSDFGERDGQRVRFLKRVKVFSVDPVFLGAGIGTRTLAVKNQYREPPWDEGTLLDEFQAVWQHAATLLAEVKEGRTLSSANVARLQDVIRSLKRAHDDLEELLRQAEPQERARAELLAAKLRFGRVEAEILGVR